MENIYNSATFFKSDYNHENKVLTNGVTRKVMRGILPCIKQEELKSKKSNIETRGTEKAEAMKGYTKITKIIGAILYGNKPVHYISMIL